MSDAKPLTTADVAELGEAFKDDEALAGSVVVDRAELLATTRALEAALAESPTWGTVKRLNDEWTEEADKLRARAELAERERDAAKTKADIYERDWYAAKQEFGDATARLRAQCRDAGAKRDAARDCLADIIDESFGLQEVLGLDDLLTRLGRLLHERGIQHSAALRERDEARATVAELVAALKPLCHPGTSGRSVVDWERARAALAKAKGGR